ncbi:hypothetical protein ZWY2020_058632 [Hordeum vulgare]|nr:hypothetical protein ZWY2020_058632 [Hordeum vulgare]
MEAFTKDMADADNEILAEYVAMDAMEPLPMKVIERELVMEDAAEIDEQGKRLPREEARIKVNSNDDEDAPGLKGRNRKRNRKRKGKAVLVVKSSGGVSAGKKAKAETPGKGAASCTDFQEVVAGEKAGKSDGPYCQIHRTKGNDLQECRQVEQLAEKQKAQYEMRNKEKAQDGVVGKDRGVRGGRRSKAQQQKEKPARGRETKEDDDTSDDEDDGEDSSDTMPCVLTGVHPCIPLPASSSSGCTKLMPWSHRQGI